VTILERDEALARNVFARLDAVFYAAAALSPATRARLEQVAARAGRPDVFFTSAWGSTETAPLATSAHFATRTTGILGLPVPGVDVKLARVEDGYELRVRGPNVTPGYWRAGGGIEPATLDEEGFLPTGDMGRFADDANPEAGLVFVGRLTENFKLSSGTWVSVAGLRLALIDAMQPLVAEVVIAGHDRAELGALAWLTPAGKAIPPETLREKIASALAEHNVAHAASSERVLRVLILDEPLSLDEGEATDKGYTNQRRVLVRRATDVERLFAEPLDRNVIAS
jgi:feruloyl-CoA synthase